MDTCELRTPLPPKGTQENTDGAIVSSSTLYILPVGSWPQVKQIQCQHTLQILYAVVCNYTPSSEMIELESYGVWNTTKNA